MPLIKKFLPLLSLTTQISATNNENVLNLHTNNFKPTLNLAKYTFVKFFAPWCPHCQDVEKPFSDVADLLNYSHEMLAKKLKLDSIEDLPEGIDVQLGEVNCDNEGRLCEGEGIEGYPSLRVYARDRFLKDVYARSRDEIIESIQGLMVEANKGKVDSDKSETNQSADLELQEAMNNFKFEDDDDASNGDDAPEPPLEDKVLKLTSSNYPEYLNPTKRPHNLFIKLFSPDCGYCEAMAYDWKYFAAEAEYEFSEADQLKIAEINVDEEALPEGLSADSVPTIVYLGKSSEGVTPEAVYYEGDRSVMAWFDFVDERLKGGRGDDGEDEIKDEL